MREGPILELAVEVALFAASRGQPYLMALEQGVSPIFGIDTGVGLVTWKRSEGSGTVQGDLSVVGGRRSWTTQQIAEVAGTAPASAPTIRACGRPPFRCGPATTSRCVSSGRLTFGAIITVTATAATRSASLSAARRPSSSSSPCTDRTMTSATRRCAALAAIQALLTSALEFRSRLDLAVDRLLNSPQLHGAAEGYCPFRREAEVLLAHHTRVDQRPHRKTPGNQRTNRAQAPRRGLRQRPPFRPGRRRRLVADFAQPQHSHNPGHVGCGPSVAVRVGGSGRRRCGTRPSARSARAAYSAQARMMRYRGPWPGRGRRGSWARHMCIRMRPPALLRPSGRAAR